MAEATIIETSRDQNGWKTTTVRLDKPRRTAKKSVFAICIKTDDPQLLTPSKVYKVDIVGDRIAAIDNEGEAAVYPSEFFVQISLPNSVRSKLESVVG